MSTLIFPPYSPGIRPRIAYANLFTSAATIVADAETAGFEFEHLYDGLPFTSWLPDSGGDHYVTATFASAQAVNFFCVYNTELYLHGGTIALEYSTDAGVTWQVAAAQTVTDNKPLYLTFDPILADHWRVHHNCATACRIAVAAFGQDLHLERGHWIGFRPPSMNYDVEVTTNVSESGTFLGRSLLKRGAKIELALDALSVDWVYTYWKPFMDAALLGTFFVQWNETDHPTEVIYAWLNASTDLQAPALSHHTTMSAGFKALGRVD